MAEVIYPLVVDEPVWNDGSDATYINFPAGVFTQVPRAGVLQSGIDPATVTAVTVLVRAYVANNVEGFSVFAEHIPSPNWGLPRTVFHEEAPTFFPVGTIATVEAPLFTSFGSEDPIAGEPEYLAEWLAADSYEITVTAGSLNGGNRVYELTLLVYTDEDTTQPPRRIYPRDDGLTGGAPRTYPASKATNTGNRVGGGYL